MGVGASFIVNYNTRVGIEFVWNVTFTDHLDDVSGTYADPASFVGDASQDLSRDMQFVLSQPANPTVAAAAGIDNPEAYLNSFRWDAAYESPRGNLNKNDSYGTLQLTVSKVVKNSVHSSKATTTVPVALPNVERIAESLTTTTAYLADPRSDNTRPMHVNQLAGSTSPYLKQHQHNPVDWHPWGDSVWEKLKLSNRWSSSASDTVRAIGVM